MRAIRKQGHGGYYLQQAHGNPPQAHTSATTRWSSFGHKNTVLGALLSEQFFICCYSELNADQEGLGYHIEHVENKGQNPSRTFDYANLAACALKSDDLGVFKARGDEVFGGHAPGKAGVHGPVDMVRFVLPHQPDCRRFFAYLSDGRVVAADGLTPPDQDRAKYTIDMLNLNSPFLITLRKQWWDELDRCFQDHLDEWSNLVDLAAVDLVPIGGKLSRFFSLTRQFFGPIAEQTLQQQAQALL